MTPLGKQIVKELKDVADEMAGDKSVASACSSVVYLDRFSEGLDEMTQRQQRDHAEVLKRLAKMDRFSIFEATENSHIAKTMDFLVSEKYITVEPLGYPWSSVKLTPKGQKVADR